MGGLEAIITSMEPSSSDEPLICVRCKKPVIRNRSNYQVFEKMHWSCFHYAYEHEGDPDISCADPDCPLEPSIPIRDRTGSKNGSAAKGVPRLRKLSPRQR